MSWWSHPGDAPSALPFTLVSCAWPEIDHEGEILTCDGFKKRSGVWLRLLESPSRRSHARTAGRDSTERRGWGWRTVVGSPARVNDKPDVTGHPGRCSKACAHLPPSWATGTPAEPGLAFSCVPGGWHVLPRVATVTSLASLGHVGPCTPAPAATSRPFDDLG